MVQLIASPVALGYPIAAADHSPTVRILATGSSTLGASSRFRDPLTGRKTEIWLTPMIGADLVDFGNADLDHRLLFGGLPPMFLADEFPEADFQEWLDAYWAKDIQELFRLERKASFQRFVELLLAQSGGIFEATRFTAPCEVSRGTITNYLAVLEATAVALVLRPFSTRRNNEIVAAPKVYGFDTGFVAAPKVYGFDTGFVAAFRGWTSLRPEDRGQLWEHYVLNELSARLQTTNLRYWRDKQGHEVDLIWAPSGKPPVAIECKWASRDFKPTNLQVFARAYPDAALLVVAPDADPGYTRRYGEITVHFTTLNGLVTQLAQN